MRRLLAGYALAGALNTALGWSIILALDLGLRAPPAASNAAGFLAGVLLSFVLHRRLFAGSGGRDEAIRYALAVAFAFLLNQAVLWIALHRLGAQGSWRHLLAQGLAVGAYSGALFYLGRFWVFRGSAKVQV